MDVQFTLNIGLEANGQPITAVLAREVIVANCFLINRAKVVQSDTEPTLVAEVTCLERNPLIILQLLNAIAEDLAQDCIAVHRPLTGGGTLIGPRAAEWGKFNPEFFFNIDGTRLAAALPRAA